MEKITVLLADASAEYRMALREKMEESGDFRIVGEAEDGQHTLQMVREMKPQVLVLDGMLPVLDGMAVLRAVQEQPKSPAASCCPRSVRSRSSTRRSGWACICSCPSR